MRRALLIRAWIAVTTGLLAAGSPVVPAFAADPPTPDGSTLVVKAVDSVTGSPVDSFCVYTSGDITGSACTGTDGVATVTGLPAATLSFDIAPSPESFYKPKYDLSATLTENETTTVTVPLVLAGKVAITATDHVTGQPVGDTCLMLRALGSSAPYGTGCTDESGTTTTVPVDAGTYEVFITAPKPYGDQWVGRSGGTGDQRAAARIAVRPGRTSQVPPVLLDPGGTITGVVTGADGSPVADVNVNHRAVENFASGEPQGVLTDTSGRFTLGGLGPYSWPLQFADGGYPYQWSGNVGNRFAAVAIPVTSGETSTYDITLRRGSALRGRIRPATSSAFVIAHNAVTGDLVGVFYGYDPEFHLGAYDLRLAGDQQVKLNLLTDLPDEDAEASVWYPHAADAAGAAKISIRPYGVKRIDLTQ